MDFPISSAETLASLSCHSYLSLLFLSLVTGFFKPISTASQTRTVKLFAASFLPEEETSSSFLYSSLPTFAAKRMWIPYALHCSSAPLVSRVVFSIQKVGSGQEPLLNVWSVCT